MVAAHPLFTGEDDYLRLEQKSQVKHEYVRGRIVAMAGASIYHNLLVANTLFQLKLQLKGRGCLVFPSDLRVRLPSGAYTYPDVSVVCATPQQDDKHPDILLNPLLVVEVLSPNTEKYDQGEKFAHYRSLDSLQEYVLIHQDTYRIQRYSRQADGEWLFADAFGRAGEVALKSLNLVLLLADIYEDLILPDEDIIPDS
jgi:Uma2 family endonuclease